MSRCHPYNGIDDDFQYKRHDGRCFKCRGPALGEGHFMPAEPVTPLLRPYTLADYKEVTGEDWGDGEATAEEFVRLMSIRGVESYIESQDDIHLDLRWFRLPDCLCKAWPCPCICEAAYAAKISKFLGIAHTTIEADGVYWWDISLFDHAEPEPEVPPPSLCLSHLFFISYFDFDFDLF